MRRICMLLIALSTFAAAQSPFDGTWKVDLKSAQFDKKPDVLVLQNGMFECKTCVPAVSVKADGNWQPVKGHPYFDQMMVKVVDDKHVKQATKKNGKDMGGETDTISADGKTMTVDWVDKSAPTGKEVTGKTTLTRVAAGPAGSHAFSGSWRAEKVADMPDEGLLFTYKSTKDGMDFNTPTGQSYSAKWNGPEVPIKGDPGNTMVSIKKMGPDSFQEISKRDGKEVGVATYMVKGDTFSATYEDKQQGRTMKYTAKKQ